MEECTQTGVSSHTQMLHPRHAWLHPLPPRRARYAPRTVAHYKSHRCGRMFACCKIHRIWCTPVQPWKLNTCCMNTGGKYHRFVLGVGCAVVDSQYTPYNHSVTPHNHNRFVTGSMSSRASACCGTWSPPLLPPPPYFPYSYNRQLWPCCLSRSACWWPALHPFCHPPIGAPVAVNIS